MLGLARNSRENHQMTSFKLEAAVKANESIPVRKYRSEATGLTVIVAEVEGMLSSNAAELKSFFFN